MTTLIAVTDTETTGLEPDKNGVCEMACTIVDPSKMKIIDVWSSMVQPGFECSIEAMATHHIEPHEYRDAPPIADAIAASPLSKAEVKYSAAHNAKFDMQFVKIKQPWLCTYRIGKHMFPDAPRHTNQVLRYYRKEQVNDRLRETDLGKTIMKLPPHRALVDTWVTAHILLDMLATKSIDELLVLTDAPVLEKVCRFGKHAGKAWKDVPRDYLQWIIRTGDFDEDVMHTARHYLGRR